jgi:hypothetical protein
LPAFTHSTLDDNPGDGDLNDGQPSGQVNLFLEWDPVSVVDLPDRWEVTLGITKGAPSNDAHADVTPRRLQQFKPSAGETVRWTNRAGRSTLQTGQIVVDQHRRVTIPQVQLRSGGTRLTLERAPAPGASEKR